MQSLSGETRTEVGVRVPSGVIHTFWPDGIEQAIEWTKIRNKFEGNEAVVVTREVTEWEEYRA